MENGKFVISLDFELLWGVFDKVHHKEKITYFKNTRQVIPKILQLFSEFEISCTWATVGMLFNSNWNEWESNRPQKLPAYMNSKLSAYNFGDSVKANGTEDLCFAPDLVRQIAETPGQELATHTYSHYYCSEKGQTVEAFQADLQKAITMAEAMGVELKSLVFPRNQLNPEYLKICKQLGIETVRSNPENWYWKETEDSSFLKKVFRTGDAYFGKRDKSYPYSALKQEPGRPMEQKASRLLRPYSENSFLNRLKVNRIKAEMKTAAMKKEIYHLWWHPHNFGENPEKNLEDLRQILTTYKQLNREFGFESVSMKELYDLQRQKQPEIV
ncbi:polysaccharide deacetylase family protein [Salinimicrobium catena]|uniref:polysaccharide deacetylase family protein n=1 Tax=Salinimicrobium catena TaxID=390640 RepID=UPI002FE4C6E7